MAWRFPMEVLTHILAFIGGLGTGYVVKIAVSYKKSNAINDRSVHQNNNSAGGDIIGGSKITNKE